MVTDKQVRRLFAMKNKVKYLYQLADKAGIFVPHLSHLALAMVSLRALAWRGMRPR